MSIPVRWFLWCMFTLVWTVALVGPVSSPEGFGPDVETRLFVKFLMAKTAHVTIYAVWTYFTSWLNAPLKVRFILLMFLMAHGVLTEWGQFAQVFTDTRSGLLRDAALDNLGVFSGVLAGWRRWTCP